jgi:hypothetical protein
LIGPSAGHLYAGETSHAVKMSALRIGALATFLLGLVPVISANDSRCGDCGPQPSNDNLLPKLALAAGGVGLVVATLYDLADAPRAARRANLRAFQLVPTAVPTSTGMAPGAVLAGRF